MKSARIQLEKLACPTCAAKVERAVKSVAGVNENSVSVALSTSVVQFDFDETQTSLEAVEAAITKSGYDVISSNIQ